MNYEELKFYFEMNYCVDSIEELEIRLKALSDYIDERKICDLMCGGVEDDSDI
jgi:hypothetical protein